MSDPWQQREVIGDAVLYLGDMISILPTLPQIDLVLTDPPYSSGGQFRGDRQQDVHTKYVQTGSSAGSDHLPFLGDTRDAMGYWFWLSVWISQLRARMRPGGICALFTDWRQLPTTSCGLQSGGFVWRGIVPWHKPSARPTRGRWTNACEFVVWGTNGPRALNGQSFPGFYSGSPPRGDTRQHMTQKPLNVIEDLLAVSQEGELVCDPFIGSGTTAIAALNLGRRFVGIEIDPTIFDVACERVSNSQRQQRLFAL